jgi:hypothetical protein
MKIVFAVSLYVLAHVALAFTLAGTAVAHYTGHQHHHDDNGRTR